MMSEDNLRCYNEGWDAYENGGRCPYLDDEDAYWWTRGYDEAKETDVI